MAREHWKKADEVADRSLTAVRSLPFRLLLKTISGNWNSSAASSRRHRCRLVRVVTASGTGAEMNAGAVITNEALGVKTGVFGVAYEYPRHKGGLGLYGLEAEARAASRMRVGPTATFPFEMYPLRINKPFKRPFSHLINAWFHAFQKEMWRVLVRKRIPRYILKLLVARIGLLPRNRYISSIFVARAGAARGCARHWKQQQVSAQGRYCPRPS